MTKLNKLLICILLFVFFQLPIGYSQKRSDLEKKRTEIIEQLEIANQQLNIAENNTKATIGELTAINAKIKSRKDLISNLDSQIKLAEKTLMSNKDSISMLHTRLKDIEQNYGKILRLAHIRSRASNKWISIFTSKSLNEALLIWRYSSQFESYISNKKSEIVDIQKDIDEKNTSIEKEKLYTQSLLKDEKSNYAQLESSQKEKDKILKKLKNKEEEIKAERDKKKKEREKLNSEIEEIILAELKARNKKKASPSSGPSDFNKKHSLPWPVEGYISTKFGKQAHPTIKNVQITNNGIDIHCKPNSKVKTIAKGNVVGITTIPGYNTMIIIEHGDYYTVYSKLETTSVSKGHVLIAGQEIGSVGSNGSLHFEIWKGKTKLDPAKWLKSK